MADEAPETTPAQAVEAAPIQSTSDAAQDVLTGAQEPTEGHQSTTPDVAALTAQIEALTASLADRDAAAAEQQKRLAAALGLTTDEAETAAPSVEDLASQVATAQAEARAAQMTAAVYRAAREAGVDADAATDSQRVTKALSEVDPGDHAAVVAALKAAVEGAPGIRARRIAASSGDEPRGGAGVSVTREQFQAMNASQRAQLFTSNRGLYDRLAGR